MAQSESAVGLFLRIFSKNIDIFLWNCPGPFALVEGVSEVRAKRKQVVLSDVGCKSPGGPSEP